MSESVLAPSPLSPTNASPPAANRDLVWFSIVSLLMLPVLTFTVPGKHSISASQFLDSFAVVKASILMLVCFGGSVVLYRERLRPHFDAIVLSFAPFLLYLGWAIFSTAWSPMKAVTIGQAGSLAALLVYAIGIALVSCDERRIPWLLKQLAIMLVLFSLFVVGFHLVAPDLSGLDRDFSTASRRGLVHPTASGSAAALGLLLQVMCYVTRLHWPRWLSASSLLVHSVLLVLSASRASILMLVISGGLMLFLFSGNRARASAMLAVAIVFLAVVAIDPGLEHGSSVVGAGTDYFARGQTASQIRQVSGRAEMWAAIWKEYLKSPILGHGYFVTSETGELKVWNRLANFTAHNIVLQVLVTTGLIGLILFAWAILRMAYQTMVLFRRGDLQAKIAMMSVFLGLFIGGWSMTCISFLGPVRAESVFFFTFVGIVAGQAISSVDGSKQLLRSGRI